MVNLTEYENRVLNIIKAKFGFKNKSEAIKLIIQKYESEFLEPELKPEFIKKMRTRENETVVQVADFRSHFGLDENV
jgi:mannitol/fructose-specific phosphotransferase system IIA component